MAVKPRQYGRKLWVLRDDNGRYPQGAPSFETQREAADWWIEHQDALLLALPDEDDEE